MGRFGTFARVVAVVAIVSAVAGVASVEASTRLRDEGFLVTPLPAQSVALTHTAVAHDTARNQFMVAMQAHPGTSTTPWRLLTSVVGADGRPVAAPILTNAVQALHDSPWHPNFAGGHDVAYNPVSDEYLLTWAQTTGPNSSVGAGGRWGAVFGLRFRASDGLPLGTPVRLTAPKGTTSTCGDSAPVVEFNPGTGGYLIAWNSGELQIGGPPTLTTCPNGVGADGRVAIRVANVAAVPAADSLVGTPVPGSRSTETHVNHDLAANPKTGQFMVTWVVSGSLQGGVLVPAADFAHLLSSSAEPVGSVIPVISRGYGDSEVTADPITGNWLIFTTSMSDGLLSHLFTSNGARIGTPVKTVSGNYVAQVAAVGDGTYVGMDDARRFIHIDASGNAIGAPVTAVEGDTFVIGNGGSPVFSVGRGAVAPRGNSMSGSLIELVEDVVTAITPGRILDSRPGEKTVDGQFQGTGLVVSGKEVALAVAGRAGVPADAAAVVLNVTAVAPIGPGFLTVYPCGTSRPLASNVNYTTGQVVPNAVVAKIGSGGRVCIFTSQSTHVLADVNAYVPLGGSPTPLVPSRVLDTRAGESTVDGQFQGTGTVASGTEVALTVAGRGNVPVDAEAVILNVTAAFPTGPGFLTVYPCGSARPVASNVNYTTGQVVPNAVLAKIGAGGKVCIFSSQSTDVLADVNAYVPVGGSPTSLLPGRVLDSRADGTTVDGMFRGGGQLVSGNEIELTVAGRSDVPGNATAVFLNVTAVDPIGPGFLTVYPCGTPRPLASNVNYTTGQVVPNAVLAKIGTAGKVCIFSSQSTDVLVDVNAYVAISQ